MGGLFSKPKVPAPPPAPPVVTVNEARNTIERNDMRLRRKGALATILNDPAAVQPLGAGSVPASVLAPKNVPPVG